MSCNVPSHVQRGAFINEYTVTHRSVLVSTQTISNNTNRALTIETKFVFCLSSFVQHHSFWLYGLLLRKSCIRPKGHRHNAVFWSQTETGLRWLPERGIHIDNEPYIVLFQWSVRYTVSTMTGLHHTHCLTIHLPTTGKIDNSIAWKKHTICAFRSLIAKKETQCLQQIFFYLPSSA